MRIAISRIGRGAVISGLVLVAQSALASTLVTPSYEITITENCLEGDVACQDVSYTSKNRRTRRTVHLKGRSIVHNCPGDQGDGPGKTPCRHVGYEFRTGKTTYAVDDDGRFTVTHGGRVVLEERGNGDWSDGVAKVRSR
jgi:hypothetical protein